MGLLTDPSAGQGKLTKALVKYHSRLGVLLYISGVIWFCFLAYTPLNAGTYFSENALLPGLVKSEFDNETTANQFYEELLDEMNKYDKAIPYPWLLAKFRQIGLDTYTHNFTLNYPLGKSHTFTGKNVYGILRAARASSTEALVMSVPYRPPSNINPTTAPSVAIMLAFAKFANRKNYWSKDIIFLITEHEQLGIQAWLEAYHSVTCGQQSVLDHGDLRGRGGAIQAAINLEFHDSAIGRMDIKVEGLNGQLPNLDFFNLATRMCSIERVIHTFKNKEKRKFKDPIKDWTYSFKTLIAMVTSQATGIPNGNHGLFHRFGIQALTLEGFSVLKKSRASQMGFLTQGRILEGIFRSLNNLLERFHQSYFFYLLPASDRFISIGLYMPSICLIAGALFVKACGKWYQLQQNDSNKEDEKESEAKNDSAMDFDEEETFNILEIGAVLILTHVIGITVMNLPDMFTKIGLEYEYNTEFSVYAGFAASSLALLIVPVFIRIKSCYKSMMILNIASLLELGTALICLSMYNFSLGLLAGTLYVPFVLLIEPNNCRVCTLVQKLLWVLVHPLLTLTITVIIYTFLTFPGESFYENLHRGYVATQQATVYGIVDSMIYSNWLFNVITCIMIPNWLCFWCILFSVPKPKTEDNSKLVQDKKNN